MKRKRNPTVRPGAVRNVAEAVRSPALATAVLSERGCSTRTAGAFSLVEVTLALGIVSFAVVSVFGAMSVGLTALRDSSKDVTNAQIIAEVSSLLAQTPFDKLGAFVQGTQGSSTSALYFDQAGRQLASPGTVPASALYRANLTVIDPAANGGGTIYPGAPADLGSSAKSVQITVSTIQSSTNATSSQAVIIVPKS